MSDIPPPVSTSPAIPKEPSQDPITLLRQQEEERKKKEFLSNWNTAVLGDPVRKLRASAMARELNLPPSVIETDMEFAQKFIEREKIATSNLMQTNPRMFSLLSDQDTLSKTYDDLVELQKSDGIWGGISRQLSAGWDMNTMSYYGIKRMLSMDGTLSPEDQAEYQNLEMYGAVAQGSDSFFAPAGRLLGQMSPSIAIGVGTVLAAPATGGASIAAGAATTGVLNALLMAGETYNQARSEGLSHGEAVAAATATGAITGYLGGAVFKKFVEPYMPTMSAMFGRTASNVATGGVSRATANKLWKQFLYDSGKGIAMETVQESAETLTQWTAIQTFKEGGFSAEERAKLAEELVATVKEVGQGMAVLGPVGPLLNAAMQKRNVTQARINKASFDRLRDSVAKSKTNARDPQTSASINDVLAQEVGVEIDPKAFEASILAAENKQLEKMAADQKITVDQLRAQMSVASPIMADLTTKIPNLMDRLQKARDENVDLRLTAGEWATHLLNSPVGDDMSFHARMEGQTYSLREAIVVDGLSKKYLDEGTELLKKTHLDNIEIVRQARQVKAAFKSQMLAAGVSQSEAEANAELIKAFTVASGLRIGKKPVEFMRSPEFALAVESAGLGRVEAKKPVTEPGAAPFTPAARPPVDLSQPLVTIDSAAFGGTEGVPVAAKDLNDAAKVREVLGKVKERLTRTVNEAKKDEMGVSSADLANQADPILADVQKLSARLLELQAQTPGQQEIMKPAQGFAEEKTQAQLDIEALEKKVSDMVANPPPKPQAEAEAFPNGRENAPTKDQKAYDKAVKAYAKHQDQIKSMRGKLAAAKAAVGAATSNVEAVTQQAAEITPAPVPGRDISSEIQQAKQQLADMRKQKAPEADIKAQTDWIKQAEQYERQLVSPPRDVADEDMSDVDLDPEEQLDQTDLQKLEQILFHGTPWIWEPEPGFPFGRPRLDKLGSGEGVAAYGWGFYTTAVESVANDYRAKEYQIVSRVTIDGKPIAHLFDTVTQDDIALAAVTSSAGLQLNQVGSFGRKLETARGHLDNIFDLAERIKKNWTGNESIRQDLIIQLHKSLYLNSAYWAEDNSLSYQFRLGRMISKDDNFKKNIHEQTANALVNYLLALKKFGEDNGSLNSRGRFEDADAFKTAVDALASKASVAAKQKALLMWYIPSHRELASHLGWDFMDKLGGVPIEEVPEDIKPMWEQHGQGIHLKPGMTYKWDAPDFSFVDWSSDIQDQPGLEKKLSDALGIDILNYWYYRKHDSQWRVIHNGNNLHQVLNVMGMLGALPNQKQTHPNHQRFREIADSIESILRDFIPEMIAAAKNDPAVVGVRDMFDKSVKAQSHMIAYNLIVAYAYGGGLVQGMQPSDFVRHVTSRAVEKLFTPHTYHSVLGTAYNEASEDAVIKNSKSSGELLRLIQDAGASLYNDMRSSWTPPKKLTAEFLLSLGYSGMRYEAGLLSGAGHIGSGDFNFVIWDQKALDSMAMISRNEELMADFRKVYESIQDGTRRGEFDPATGLIMLLENKNTSTLTHELAHWMLESMGKMAMDPNADQSIRDNMATLLSWFGIKDGADGRPALDIWMSSPLSERREGHERFAISFEDWLLKGQAPTIGMSRMFDQLRMLMMQAYGDVYNPLNEAYKRRFGKDLPGMTAEVKEVFTRMIDADRQIDDAEADAGMTPRFTTKEQWVANGGDDKGWQEYQTALADARADAKADLTAQSEKAMAYLVRSEAAFLRDIQKKYDSEYEKTRAEVEKEMRAKTEYKLIQFLTKGVAMDDDGNPIESTRQELHRLDRDKVVAILTGRNVTEIKNWMTELVAAGMDLTSVQRFIRKEGLNPEDVAHQYGYQNGTQMLTVLRDTKPFDEAVDAETAARMQKKDGFVDVKNAPMKVVAPLVAKALHNKARMKFVAIEIGALIKSQQPVKLVNAAAQRAATDKLRKTQLGEVFPHKSMQTAKRYRALTMMHLGKAESTEAAQAAEQELLYTHLHQQQLEFQEFLKNAQQRLKDWARKDKDLARTRDIDIVNVGRMLLSQFGMYSGETAFDTDKMLAELKVKHPHVWDSLQPIIMKAAVYRQRMEQASRPSKSMPYNMLTVDEFKLVMAHVDGLWDTAKNVRMAEINEQKITIDQQEEEIVGQVMSNGVSPPPPGTTTWWERMKQTMGVSIGDFTARLEHYFKFMDNGIVGAFTKHIWRPMNAATIKYQDMMFEYCKKYADILKQFNLPSGQIIAAELMVDDPATPGQKTPFIFGRGSNQGKAELIKFLMNLGNASNRKYAINGFNFDPVKLDQFMERMFREGVLTDTDLDLVQQVFDLTESLGGQANDAFKKMHGYKVEMIPPTAIVNPVTGKSIKGGYIPIVSDKWVAPRVDLHGDNLEIDLDGFSSSVGQMIPSVQSDFLKDRTERKFPPLDLSLSRLSGHIENVVRFVSVAPALRQVKRLISRPNVMDALSAHDPTVINKLLKPWLVRVANQSVGNAAASPYWNGSVWRNLRVGGTANAMATNIGAMLQNVLGFFPAARQVGYTNLMRSIWNVITNFGDMKKFAFENSDFLRQSSRDGMYEVMTYIHSQGRVGKISQLNNKVAQSLMVLQKITQTPLDIAIWNAKYQQVMGKLSPTMDYDEAHKEAKQQADSLVQTTQNANRPIDVALSETGSEAYRVFTSLTGWFTNMVNLNRFEAQRILRDEVGWTNKTFQLAELFFTSAVMPVVVGQLVADFWYGKGFFDDEDDEEKDTLLLSLRSVYGLAKGVAAPLPGVSQVTRAMENLFFDDSIINDKLPTAPGVDMLFNAIRRANNSDEFFSMTNLDTFSDMVTMLSGGRIPLNVVSDPIKSVMDEKSNTLPARLLR